MIQGNNIMEMIKIIKDILEAIQEIVNILGNHRWSLCTILPMLKGQVE